MEAHAAELRVARAHRRNLTATLARHLAWGVVTIFLVSLVTFFGSSLKSPTELAQASLGRFITHKQAEVFIQTNHLDRPLVLRYGSWLGQISRGDLGTSVITHRRVSADVVPRLYRTLILTGLTLLIAVPLGLVLAIWSARRKGRPIDVAANSLAVVIAACPEFVIGLAFLLIFGVAWKVLPIDSGQGIAFGSTTAQIKSYVLPIATLVTVSIPFIMRTCRVAVSEVLSASYVRAATLRGVPRRRVVWNHALRNAAPTILNSVGLNAVYLLSGVIVVENVFAFPGLGQALVAAVGNGDTTTVQAIAVVLGVTFVLMSIATDALAATLNPRSRAGGE
jgi:peptide/nickel transport system permease protein